jgi:hypothetical protein
MNILKIERRYYVFDEKTFSRLLKLLKTMTTYTMDPPEKTKILDYYYDNDENMLEKNELLLRRRVIGKKGELKIKRRFFHPEFYYSDNLRSNERETEIPANDPLSRHYFFLNNALNSMFANNLQFDTDKMFEKMRVTMMTTTFQDKRFLYGYGGLKVLVEQDRISVKNILTKRKNKTELIQFKLVSNDATLPLFEDFITRIEKHCKEIFYTQDSKYEAGFKITKPLPSKEEREKLREEFLKKKQMQAMEENIVEKKE